MLTLQIKHLFRYKKNPIDDSPNRVTVQGLPLALNDLVIVSVDDAESQTEEIRESPAPFLLTIQ